MLRFGGCYADTSSRINLVFEGDAMVLGLWLVFDVFF